MCHELVLSQRTVFPAVRCTLVVSPNPLAELNQKTIVQSWQTDSQSWTALERRTENCSHARHHERHMSTEGHCALCIMRYGRWGSQEAAIVRNASGDRPGLLTSASVLGVRWAKLGANCKCSLRAVHCSWPHTGLYRVRKKFWNARHA